MLLFLAPLSILKRIPVFLFWHSTTCLIEFKGQEIANKIGGILDREQAADDENFLTNGFLN